MGVQEVEEHLRGASDAIMLLLREVQQLEGHKRGVKPADPRFAELARSVRVVAEALAKFAIEQEVWATKSATADDRIEPIAEAEASPSLATILERWREVERALDDVPPGSNEARQLFSEFERLRDQYLLEFRSRESEQNQKA
jgi:hypothetical protein